MFKLRFKFHLLFLNTFGGSLGKTFCSLTATVGPLFPHLQMALNPLKICADSSEIIHFCHWFLQMLALFWLIGYRMLLFKVNCKVTWRCLRHDHNCTMYGRLLLQDVSNAASSVWAGCPTPPWWRPSSASRVWLSSAAVATWLWLAP